MFCRFCTGLIAVLFGLALACCTNAQQTTEAASPSQQTDTPGPSNVPAASSQQADSETNTQRRGAFLVAPLPISSPALGTGLVPVVGYIFPLFKNDKASPPSVIAGAALITDNGSRAFAVAGDFYFKKDRYHTAAIYARGNLNYDLYGIGVPEASTGLKLPLQQTGEVLLAECLRRIGWRFFAGPRFLSGNSTITIRPGGSDVPPPPDVGLETKLTSLGFHLQRDTRPNRFYATGGTLLDFTADFFAQGLGSKYSFQSYRFNFSKYWNLGEKQVLAYNLNICGTGGSPPFYGNCIYGTNNQLRGYTAGQYLDRYMYATQLEYRRILWWRFGAVVFGGVGEVVPGGSQLAQSEYFLPAGGGGIRFLLSKKYHVNLRADVAAGKESHTWAMGVGEAF